MFLSQKYLFFLAEKIGGISGFILPPFEENVYGEKAFPYLGFPSFTEKSAKQYLKGSLKCILRSVRIFVTPSERVDTIIRNLIVWRNSVLWVRRFQLDVVRRLATSRGVTLKVGYRITDINFDL